MSITKATLLARVRGDLAPVAFSGGYADLSGKPTLLSQFSNDVGYITGINGSTVTTALGFTPYDAANPAGYVTQSGARAAISATQNLTYNSTTGVLTGPDLTPYLTSASAASTYLTSAAAASTYLTSASAASTYQPTLVSGTNIKTINGTSILGSGDITISGGGTVDWASVNAALEYPQSGVAGGTIRIGTGAMGSTTGASLRYSVVIGYQAMQNSTGGDSTVAIGVGALRNNTSLFNVAVGANTGASVTTFQNTFVGASAGSLATSGDSNTFLGYNAGSAVTTGGKNAILGSYTGNQGGLDIRTLSNYIILSDGDGNPRVVVNNAGTTLIGATSFTTSDGRLRVAGVSGSTAAAQFFMNGTGSNNNVVLTNGNGQVGSISTNGTTTAYNTSSDYRLKENVQPMAGALARIAALKPVTYTWKCDGSAGEGFIAHELAEVCPQAVNGEKDAVDAEGNPVYQGIDTSFLVATLVAAVQEQQAVIAQLRADVAALQAANS